MKLPRRQEALFREVLLLFEQEHIPYAVSGAFALRQHTGISRFTKDLDIFLTPKNVSLALQYLGERDFECEISDPIWLAKARRKPYFVDLISGMSNGVITVEPSWIERSHPAVIFGMNTRVLAPEELIVSKLFVTRRERFDGADIVHVIYALGKELQWNRILELAGEHWELVLWNLVLFRYIYPAHSDYVPQALWEELLDRFAREIQVANPGSGFRGGLIDPRMFAIDIDEWKLNDVLEDYQNRCTKIRKLAVAGRGTRRKRAA